MEKVIVFFRDNWAGEMDINGFHIYETMKWNKIVEKCKAHKGPVGASFGTNESNEYQDGEDFISSFTVKPIDDLEYKMIKELFEMYQDQYKYGNFPTAWDWWD